ncbi:MAG: DNA mismatch repair endonuclease MutL [Verrucomicrobia bacterium]|nr:DNA mismatch repair endonuclease MutL [Verrucomicrobiota bacterium]
MNRIRLLPEQVANQIAAGEVIERPASVVKELVENALDAQAARVTVEIGAGGRSLVRVTDDGLGMSRDDALLCLERHATSKIRKAEDLAAIATLGFRGEAIPSIASVSRMTITTRERDSQSAASTQVVIHGGKILEVRDAGSPPGTCVEVRSLFYNLPARRKFLRTEETETAHVQHYLTLAALACPEVAFTFVRDSRPIWQLPAVRTEPSGAARLLALKERMRALFGGETQFLTVDFAADLAELNETETADEAAPSPAPSPFRLWGYLGAPGVSRGTREDQHLFVNRRPVENRALNFALLEGYHTALMKGRFPVCCLFLEINPASVDVNVHPAKREVKFHNEREVRRLVAQAVREMLLQFHGGEPAKSEVQGSKSKVEGSAVELGLKPTAARTEEASGTRAASEATTTRVPPSAATSELPLEVRATPLFKAEGTAVFRPLPSQAVRPSLEATPPPPQTVASPRPASESANLQSAIRNLQSLPPTPLLSVPLRLVGVIGRLYVVLESDRGLVLLDQHAAHERILFEQVLQRLEQGPAPSQRLLLPETMELSARDAQFVRELLPTFARLGVGLSEFGERTFLLDALPPFVKAAEPRRFVLDVVDELKASGESVNALRLGEHTVAKTVCRHAVKAHDPLAGPELENLVEDLRHCAMPYTCPHGRPTMIEMNFRELEKKFGRLG